MNGAGVSTCVSWFRNVPTNENASRTRTNVTVSGERSLSHGRGLSRVGIVVVVVVGLLLCEAAEVRASQLSNLYAGLRAR
jgi:hypothetical protein